MLGTWHWLMDSIQENQKFKSQRVHILKTYVLPRCISSDRLRESPSRVLRGGNGLWLRRGRIGLRAGRASERTSLIEVEPELESEFLRSTDGPRKYGFLLNDALPYSGGSPHFHVSFLWSLAIQLSSWGSIVVNVSALRGTGGRGGSFSAEGWLKLFSQS